MNTVYIHFNQESLGQRRFKDYCLDIFSVVRNHNVLECGVPEGTATLSILALSKSFTAFAS
jgi:hypothetical protein